MEYPVISLIGDTLIVYRPANESLLLDTLGYAPIMKQFDSIENPLGITLTLYMGEVNAGGFHVSGREEPVAPEGYEGKLIHILIPRTGGSVTVSSPTGHLVKVSPTGVLTLTEDPCIHKYIGAQNPKIRFWLQSMPEKYLFQLPLTFNDIHAILAPFSTKEDKELEGTN
jgi:hypothetical protein